MSGECARTEYLQAVLDFHEPNTPPTTCMWCGLPSPCPPYLQAKSALAREYSPADLPEGILKQ